MVAVERDEKEERLSHRQTGPTFNSVYRSLNHSILVPATKPKNGTIPSLEPNTDTEPLHSRLLGWIAPFFLTLQPNTIQRNLSLHLMYFIHSGPDWFVAKKLACHSFGKPKSRQKLCHHFGRINVRCRHLLALNQVMAQELAMPKFWHATILVANQLGPACKTPTHFRTL